MVYIYIYCTSNNYNVFEATEKQVLEFLTKMFEDGASYGTLNTARPAVFLISKATLSESRDICEFFKGLFKLKPTKPRYNKIWSTEPVLQKASELYPLNSLASAVPMANSNSISHWHRAPSADSIIDRY